MKTILVDALDTFVIEGEGIYQPMFELLETYPNPKIIVSNADDKQLVGWGLDKMPYEVFTLKHQPDKTDPKFFEILFQQKGLDKDSVIYFEHNPDAVKSAQSLGIKTFYYDKDKRDLAALKNFLTENLTD
jgi:HAD superfamily hydrolase (TIGR01509 family)